MKRTENTDRLLLVFLRTTTWLPATQRWLSNLLRRPVGLRSWCPRQWLRECRALSGPSAAAGRADRWTSLGRELKQKLSAPNRSGCGAAIRSLNASLHTTAVRKAQPIKFSSRSGRPSPELIPSPQRPCRNRFPNDLGVYLPRSGFGARGTPRSTLPAEASRS